MAVNEGKEGRRRTRGAVVICATKLARMMRSGIAAATKDHREICGLLVDSGHCWHLVELRNKSRRSGQFSFYVKEVRAIVAAAKVMGFEVVGTFHSHPAWTADPGDGDLAGALDDSFLLILDVSRRASRLWHVHNLRAKQVKFSLCSSQSGSCRAGRFRRTFR